MRMLKFWMVLSSIVLGVAVPVSQGYAQEEMAEVVAQEQDIVDVEIEANQKGEKEQKETSSIEKDKELLNKEKFVPEELPVQEVELLEQEVSEVSTENSDSNNIVQEGEIKEVVQSEESAPEEALVEKIAEPEPESSEVSLQKIKDNEAELVQKMDTQELEQIDEEDVEDEEIESIDTIDLNDPQGNWLIKRFWFNKSEQIYEQMSKRIQLIFDFGSEFQQKSVELDQKLFDPFYLDIGIGRGELTELVDSLIEQLRQNEDLTAERDPEESEYFQRLEEEKGTLEQLKADIEGVSDIDKAVNSALATFNERANLSRNYHSKVWHLLQEIAHELNDKKARELYYTIKSLARSVVDIEEYITSPFSQYFDELSNKADEQINRIKQEVAVLKKRGIDLKEKVSELENLQQKEELEKAAQQGYNASEQAQQKREEKERGFFSSIGGMVQYMWNAFYSFLQKFFTPAKKQAVQAEAELHDAKEPVIDMTPRETEGAVESQELEGSEVIEPVVEIQEAELELASDAEQQEAMTAGAEEVELIKAAEEVESIASEDEISGAQEETEMPREMLEAQPATAANQEPITSSVETDLEQEQAQ